MKTQYADYQTQVLCLRIEPVIGDPIRLTSHPRNLTMSNGEIYLTNSGYEFTGYTSTTSLSPSAIDLQGIVDVAGIGRDKIASGFFDNARCYLFATEWTAPVEDYEPIVASTLGKTTIRDDKYYIEEMALIDALNQSVGLTYTAQCPKTFGGQEFAGCKFVLVPVTGSITSVTSTYIFRDNTRLEAADWFGAGTIQFTSGANVGLKPLDTKSYALDGTIEVFEAPYYAVEVGDTYTMSKGCRKRKEDCIANGNIINFGGFSNIPSSSQYAQIGLN